MLYSLVYMSHDHNQACDARRKHKRFRVILGVPWASFSLFLSRTHSMQNPSMHALNGPDDMQDGRTHGEQAEVLQEKVLARMRHAGMWSAFASWQTFWAQRRAARRLLQRLVHQHVSAAFNSWAAYAARMASANSLLKHVLQSNVASCFERWRCISHPPLVCSVLLLHAAGLKTPARWRDCHY